MAIITAGPLAGRISGSIASVVFSRNRGGAYVRNRAIPVDPNTTFQIEARAILAARSQEWADLTAAQRASWENWALQNLVTNALGAEIRLSGAQAYNQLNSRIAHAGIAVITDPPIINAQDGLTSLSITADIGAGAVAATFTVTPLAAAARLWMQAAVTNSPGISYVRNLLKFIGVGPGADVSPFDFEAFMTPRFGTLVVGQTVHVRFGTFDGTTGLLSVPLQASVLVTTT